MIDTVDEQIFRRTQWSDDIVSRGFAVKNVINIFIVTMIIYCHCMQFEQYISVRVNVIVHY